MSRVETLNTRLGEMLDLMACKAIENGAKIKQPEMTLEDILEMK